MKDYFEKLLEFTDKLHLEVVNQNDQEELLVVSNEEKGIFQMVIDCEYPILVFEQLIYQINKFDKNHFLRLLQMNLNLIHGAFVLDEPAKNVIFRDTLQLENLDFNEFEGTINSLTLGLAEYSGELLNLNQ